MGTYVTSNGYNKKTFEEIKTELETSFRNIFGTDIDLQADSPFAQLIGVLAKREADLWDGSQEIYNSRDPNKSEGTSLDNIAAESGISRLPAIETSVPEVECFGDIGTIIPSGSLIRQPLTELNYESNTVLTLTNTNAIFGKISIDSSVSFPLSGGELFTVTIDSIDYTYTGITADDAPTVLAKIITELGSWGGTASVIENAIEITDSDPFNFTVNSNLDIDQVGCQVDFVCTETGPNTASAGTLTEIVTPITGWDSVNNPIAGETGRNVETDEEFRIRRARVVSTPTGSATEEAIKTALFEEVSGVIGVTVTSNRTDVIDGDGRPPHSFECVIQGGNDSDIAEKIWEKMPAGIRSYGNKSGIITDSTGRNQTIEFSRAVPQYVWVRVTRSDYLEESYPADGDTQIKTAIVAWADTNQPLGKDIIHQRLSTPIYSVPGTDAIIIEVAITATPGGTPSYVSADIAIEASEIAIFDTSRISIITV